MTKSDLRQYQRPNFPLPPTTKWSEIIFYANRMSTTTSTNVPLAVGFATECNKIPGILTYPIEIHHMKHDLDVSDRFNSLASETNRVRFQNDNLVRVVLPVVLHFTASPTWNPRSWNNEMVSLYWVPIQLALDAARLNRQIKTAFQSNDLRNISMSHLNKIYFEI